MNQKKSTQTLKSILQTLTSVFLNWLNLFWQITRGFVILIKRQITKFKRQLRSTKVNNQITKTPFAPQERGQFGNIKKQRPTLYQYLKLFTPKFRFKSWKWKRFILSMTMTFILTLQFTGINWWQLPQSAQAAAVLKIEPLTWDFVGLDSNKPEAPDNQGPKDYMVGVRVCNMGDEPVRDVTVKYHNDGVDNGYTYINIATDTLYLDYLPPNLASIPNTIAQAKPGYIFETGGTANASKYDINFTPTNCADFYINFDVDRDTAAWHTTQKYYMEATAIDSSGALVGPVRTPQPRQIYIEQLISQARNSILDFYCDTPSGAGQRGTVNVGVGDVMICTAVGHTSTAYPQLSFTANFPNIIFQILDVNTTYTNPTGGLNSAVYADGCGWVQDPTSPDYHRSPTNCAGAGWPGQYIENSGGEGTGLDVVTKYTVKVLSKPVAAGPIAVSNIILDFSGGSFHYNQDYGTEICPTTNCLLFNIDDSKNSDLKITKSHDGNFIIGDNKYILDIENVSTNSAKDIKIYDTLPVGYSFNEADIIANDGVGQDGKNWYCIVTDPTAYGGSARNIVCNFNNATFLDKTDDFITSTAKPSGNNPQQLIFNVKVSASAAINSTNVACVKALNDNNKTNDCDDDPTTIVGGADLILIKDDGDNSTTPYDPLAPEPTDTATMTTWSTGETGNYTFNVKNNGNLSAEPPFILVDTLPTGFTYQSVSGTGWTCSPLGQTITCINENGGNSLAVDATLPTLVMTVAIGSGAGIDNVTTDDSDNTTTSDIEGWATNENTATISSQTYDPKPLYNTSTENTRVVVPAPDLIISKTDFDTVIGDGDRVEYEITVTNVGQYANSYPITVTDNLNTEYNTTSTAPNAIVAPGYTTSGGATAGDLDTTVYEAQGWNCTFASPDLVCSNPAPLPPGASLSYRIQLTDNDDDDGVIPENSVLVFTEGENNTTNNTASDNTPIGATGANQDIAIKKCFNFGTSTEITSTEEQNNMMANIICGTTSPESYIYETINTPTISAGTQITYRIIIGNETTAGNTDGAYFKDVLPPELEFSAATDGWRCDPVPGTGLKPAENLCGDPTGTTNNASYPTAAGSLDTNSTMILPKIGLSKQSSNISGRVAITITATVKTPFDGSLSNTATAIPIDLDNKGNFVGFLVDTDPTNNVSSRIVSLPKPDLTISKAKIGAFEQDLESTYQITVTNVSANDTTDPIIMTDTLPPSFTYVYASGTDWVCNHEATTNQVVCTYANVLPGTGSVPNNIAPPINISVIPTTTGSFNNLAVVSTFNEYHVDPVNNPTSTDGARTGTPNSDNDDLDPVTIIAPNVDLSIVKDTDPSSTNFNLGQQGTYTLNITNNGSTTAAAPIVITDQLPPGITFLNGVTTDPSLAGANVWVCSAETIAPNDFQTVTCTRNTNLAGGDTAGINMNVLVTASTNTTQNVLCESATYSTCNTVSITSQSTDTNTNNNYDEKGVNIDPASDLAIYKKAISQTSQLNEDKDGDGILDVKEDTNNNGVLDGGEDLDGDGKLDVKEDINNNTFLELPQFLIGNTGQFEITVVNNGPSTYTGAITFTDDLKENFDFISGSGGGFSCTSDNASPEEKVTCNTTSNITLTPGGSAVVKINVGVANTPTAAIADTGAGVAGDNISNTATITSPVNNSSNIDTTNDSATTAVDIEPFVADLRLQKDDGDGDPPQKPEDEPAVATDRAYFTTSTTAPPGGGTWKGAYTLEVTNNGPAIASYPVRITDTLPTGLTFNSANGVGWNCSASAGQNIDCTYDITFDKNGDTVINNNDDFLRSGENTGVEIIVNVSPTLLPSQGGTGSVTNSATVTSGTTDSNTNNNTNSEITIIREAADLSVSKVDDSLDKNIGETITYTITIHNDSVNSLGNPVYQGNVIGPIYATDYLPEGVTYVAGSLTTGSESTGVTCNWSLVTNGGNYVSFVCNDDLPYNATSTFSFKVTVNPNAQSIEKNLVRVGASIDEPDNPDRVICDRTDIPLTETERRNINQLVNDSKTNNCAIEETPIANGKNANLVIVKQAGATNDDNPPAESLNNGDAFTYTFTVSNNGADDAQDVLLKDVFPTGVIPADTNAGTPGIQITYTINTGHTTSTLPTLPASTTVNRTCSYNEGANTFSCNLYTVSNQEKTGGTGPIIITLNMIVNTASGTPSNEATLESSTSDDTQNNNCTVNSFANTAITNCDLELIRVGIVPQVNGYKSVKLTTDADTNSVVTTNDVITWTISYKNTGTVDINTFQITDILPVGVSYSGGMTISASGTGQTTPVVNGSYTGAGNNNLFNAPVILKADGVITVNIPVTVTAVGTVLLSDQANATGDILAVGGVNTDNVDNTTTLPSGVTVPSSSIPQTQTATIDPTTVLTGVIPVKGFKSVKLTTDVGTTGLTPSDTVTWSIFYTNTGTVDIPNFQVTDVLPAGVTKSGALVITTNVAQSANNPVVNASYDGTGNNNLFDAPVTLKAGGIIQVDIPVTINAGETGLKQDQASATGNGLTTPVLTDNVDSDSTGLPAGITIPANSIKQIESPTIDPTVINITTTPQIVAYKSVQLTTDTPPVNSAIDPGDTVTWTVSYVNMGTVDVSGFNITDPINTDLTYVSPLAITTNTAQSGNIPAVNASYNGTGNNNLFDTNVTFKAGGIINITLQTQVKAGVTGTKTNQGTGNDTASTKTDNIDNTTTGLPSGVIVPTASITQTQVGTIDPTAITISTGGKPNIILLKRITGIYRNNTPVVTGTQPFSQFFDDPSSEDSDCDPPINACNSIQDDNETPWPDSETPLIAGHDSDPDNIYLRGAVDGGNVQADDEIEFTIYFLNKGDANAQNTILCDKVPENLDFVANAYGSGKGIALASDNTKLLVEPDEYLTNGDDAGENGIYFPPKINTTVGTTSGITCSISDTDNTDGVVAVKLGTVPPAKSWTDASPNYNSYGFIRFRAKVK